MVLARHRAILSRRYITLADVAFVHHSACNSIRMNAHENRILFNNEEGLVFFFYTSRLHGTRWRSREKEEEEEEERGGEFPSFSFIVRN